MTYHLPIPALTSTGALDKPNRNHLLYEFHLEGAENSAEWLFQLARHWADWQSPAIGTFPLDYRDPSGPASREISEETGEDSTYWTIADIIAAIQTDSADPRAVEKQIVHATRVISHIDAVWFENHR